MGMAKNVTIQKIISILLQRIKFIITAGVVVGLVFFLYTYFMIPPAYSTSSMIYVQNYNNEGAAEEVKKIYNSDISGSKTLASICITLFQNSDELVALYDGCSVSMSTTNDTFFIVFNVAGNDPEKCANVANQLAEKSQEVFHNYFLYGQIGTIRAARVPANPYSPNKMQNTLIGVAVGLIGACAISILLELIDTTIKSDDDIQSMYGIPVFAEIPDFNTGGK